LQKTTTTDAKLSTRQEKPPENMHFGGRLMTFPQLWCFFFFLQFTRKYRQSDIQMKIPKPKKMLSSSLAMDIHQRRVTITKI
jgi:hypothetical protein